MKVSENSSLLPYNSFRIDVKTQLLIEIENEEDLNECFEKGYFQVPKYFILGGGTNTLFTQDFTGTIFRIALKGIRYLENRDSFEVIASAGEKWNDLVHFCLENQIGGIENLSLIPGTVGASPVQNIGAYGVELKDIFYKLKAFEIKTGKIKWFSREDCRFGYRRSIFKTLLREKFIILQVYFIFPKKINLHLDYGAIRLELEREKIIEPKIHDISRIISRIRQEKLPDPSTIGNAGSFFKNPIVNEEKLNQLKLKFPDLIFYPAGDDHFKLAAGWMIEKCGWKGKNLGSAGTWKNQALVLVNLDDAVGADILHLAQVIIDSVKEAFSVELEPEVNII